jgi:hypothetical protein
MPTGPREEPIFPGWVKGLMVLLVLGGVALIAIPNISIDFDEVQEFFETTEQTTELTPPEPEVPATPGVVPPGGDPEVERLQALGECVTGADGDVDRINACFERFRR